MGGESPAQILVAHLRRQGIRDEVVLRALIRVPRELFIAQELRHLAYEDEALPLEEGQTISQPIVVATMTEALRVAPGQRVLEVGTGSGYQAAVLAEMGAEVVTVERRPRQPGAGAALPSWVPQRHGAYRRWHAGMAPGRTL